MKKLSELIAEKSFTEYPHSGLLYRLRPCVGADLMREHSALLVAVLPPNMADLLTQATIDNTEEGPDKEELKRIQAREAWARISDPANQEAAFNANVSALCACVVAIREDAEGSEWEDARIVENEKDRDHAATPPRFHTSDLPPGAIAAVGGVARELSFGGEDARNRIRSFCAQRHAASVRKDGQDVRGSTERTAEA